MASLILRKTPQNWYEDHLKFTLELVESFINSTEKQILISIQEFINTKETIDYDEDDELNTIQTVEMHNGLDSLTWDIDTIFKEHFPNLQRRSAFITLFGFLEYELDQLCILFEKNENYKVQLKDFKDSGIERSMSYLEKVANLGDIKVNNNTWDEIKSIKLIRNTVVHNDGKLVSSDGKSRTAELIYIKKCIFLEGDNEIILKDGFLIHVLRIFEQLFIKLDNLIKDKYKNGSN
ncbi:hypothetical protein MYP_3283 [Sporocytophaga myxococcoides]|uniref:MAE-28990/MAE-18760-like HEPN domain-containing protein n=1 Tax=Sporocytophaga myxococcoides TaxID=153721 RepID=A0A098LHX9_9BACT|nr:hypothetical protein [Sporocytophaga myxococcoides]GAL86054.1 hypothetical protein MYP_3283 [Sporocytophaga myxococcoides]